MSMFIKLEGADDASAIKGDSTIILKDGDDDVDGLIEVNSFSYSSSQPTSPVRSNTGPTSTRPSHSLFNFTKLTDSASPLLCQALWKATVLPTASFYACRDDGGSLKVYMAIIMGNAVVANYSVSGGGGVPYENVAINYSTITVNYYPQAEEGGLGGVVAANWDLTTESDEGGED